MIAINANIYHIKKEDSRRMVRVNGETRLRKSMLSRTQNKNRVYISYSKIH
jgi:hypothetical protein